jgi:transposase
MDVIEIFSEFKGIVVHGGWKSYNIYECDYAYCNHNIRENLLELKKTIKVMS